MKHDRAKRSERIGHFGKEIAIGGGVGGILADLGYALIGPWDWFFTVLGLVCMVAFVFGVVASIGHNEANCLVCMEEFPIEHAEEMAERHSRSLRIFHLVTLFQDSGARTVSALCSLIRRKPVYIPAPYGHLVFHVFVVATALILLTMFVPSPWGNIVFMTYVTSMMVVYGRHQRLQAWCPWCRNDDDDGDDEQVPDPDPATGKTLHA